MPAKNSVLPITRDGAAQLWALLGTTPGKHPGWYEDQMGLSTNCKTQLSFRRMALHCDNTGRLIGTLPDAGWYRFREADQLPLLIVDPVNVCPECGAKHSRKPGDLCFACRLSF